MLDRASCFCAAQERYCSYGFSFLRTCGDSTIEVSTTPTLQQALLTESYSEDHREVLFAQQMLRGKYAVFQLPFSFVGVPDGI
jgi:hypothetical protein